MKSLNKVKEEEENENILSIEDKTQSQIQFKCSNPKNINSINETQALNRKLTPESHNQYKLNANGKTYASCQSSKYQINTDKETKFTNLLISNFKNKISNTNMKNLNQIESSINLNNNADTDSTSFKNCFNNIQMCNLNLNNMSNSNNINMVPQFSISNGNMMNNNTNSYCLNINNKNADFFPKNRKISDINSSNSGCNNSSCFIENKFLNATSERSNNFNGFNNKLMSCSLNGNMNSFGFYSASNSPWKNQKNVNGFTNGSSVCSSLNNSYNNFSCDESYKNPNGLFRSPNESPNRLNFNFNHQRNFQNKKLGINNMNSQYNFTNKKGTSLFMNNDKEEKADDFKDLDELLNSIEDELWFYAKSQKGSRNLQKLLNKIQPNELDIILEKIKDHFYALMTDTYGNYFCQKLIQCCSSDQRVFILEHVKTN